MGNSITSRANWNDLLDRNDIANRGVSGDITEGFLLRLDNVIAIEPKFCFIMGGINDLELGLNAESIAANISNITKILVENNIEPVIFSILYSSSKKNNFKTLNNKIQLTNELIKMNCQKSNIEYIDLNEILSKNEILISKYTTDGIHLSMEGYYKWAEFIRPIINSKSTNSQ